MSNAFAPIVRARPNPIFGRPVHQGSPPIDYSPILLLKPFGFRIAPDTLSSDENLVGQRGITPAFGLGSREGQESTCAVRRRRFPVGARPTRRTLQPEATGAGMEETKCLKPPDSGHEFGDRASVQAATRVNAEQTSKRTMCRPTR